MTQTMIAVTIQILHITQQLLVLQRALQNAMGSYLMKKVYDL